MTVNLAPMTTGTFIASVAMPAEVRKVRVLSYSCSRANFAFPSRCVALSKTFNHRVEKDRESTCAGNARMRARSNTCGWHATFRDKRAGPDNIALLRILIESRIRKNARQIFSRWGSHCIVCDFFSLLPCREESWETVENIVFDLNDNPSWLHKDNLLCQRSNHYFVVLS